MMLNARPAWLEGVWAFIQSQGPGGLALCLPEYRPDIVREIATLPDLAYVDFRAARMVPLGWEAARLGVDALDDAIAEALHAGNGVVMQNAEALLACQTAETRQQWLTHFLTHPWSAPVLIPFALFGSDLPQGSRRILTIQSYELPEESLLVRLAGH